MPVLTKGKNEQNNVGEESLASVISSMRRVCVNPASEMVTLVAKYAVQNVFVSSVSVHFCLSLTYMP